MKRLFLDLETSPNEVFSWRIGHNLDIGYENILKERRIICAAWGWEDRRRVESLTWDTNQDDKKLLTDLLPVLTEADEVVAHNGDRFDVPWLRARCLKHRIKPFPAFVMVDTLKLARKYFFFNSNALDYLAQFAGHPGKVETGGFDLWKRVCAGDEKALTKMVRYCKGDVKALQALYKEIATYCPQASHRAVLEGLSGWACPRCASKDVQHAKLRITPMGIERHQLVCLACHGYYTISAKTYRSMLEELAR